jgi:hypothetical protein
MRNVVVTLVVCWGVAAVGAGMAVVPAYDAAGLRSLLVDGGEQLVTGAVRITGVRTAGEFHHPDEMTDPYVKDERTFADASVEVRESTFDAAAKRLTQAFDWGSVTVTYGVVASGFDLEIAIHNRSTQVIEQVGMDLLDLRLPAGASVAKGGHNRGAPVLASIAPPLVHYRRVSFPRPVDTGLAELLGDEAAETRAVPLADVRILCPACFPKTTAAHLMETKEAAVPLGEVSEGVCAACGSHTRLPAAPLVVAGTTQADRPLTLLWEGSGADSAALRAVIGDERAPEIYDGLWNVRPIKPGATEIVQVGLRFGAADQPALVVGADFLEAFRSAHPLVLNWPDRRPIAMAQLSAETDWGKGNPRGWWGLRDNGADIDTPAGRAIFDTWIMGYADQLIAVADKAGSQGVIVWDLEGKQYPGGVYYGDPRIMQYTAPEMEAMADAFFKRLTDAGLRVGVCIRPTQIYPKAVPDDEVEQYRPHKFFAEMPYHETWDTFNLKSFGLEFWAYGELGLRESTPLTDIKRSPVERLDAKIKYCQERWGATLFYIDTNHFNRSREKRAPNAAGGYDITQNWGAALIKAEDWEDLCRRHPDVLLIPEHEYPQYWASTAPYRQPPHDGTTPELVRAIYPEAFSAIAMNGDAETHIRKALVAYTAAVQRGDLLMHHGWYGPSTVVTDMYPVAAASAPLRVMLAADGSLFLQGRPIPDLETLTREVAALVQGKPFGERRTFVQYAPATERQTRSAALAALTRAGAVIAWSQPVAAE